MDVQKEVFELWKDLTPEGAFAAGVKDCAGNLWVPSHYNVKSALKRIDVLEAHTKDERTLKLLSAFRRELLNDEPHYTPSAIMNTLYTHLVIEGVNDEHIQSLALQSLNHLGVKEYLLDSTWPIEIKIYTIQACDSANSIILSIKPHCSKETKQALTAVQRRLRQWKQRINLKLKSSAYRDIMPLLRRTKGLNRKHYYRAALKDLYDYTETPEDIEKLAMHWLNNELPLFRSALAAVAKRYRCKPSVEHAELALAKHQHVHDILKTLKTLRTILQPIAHTKWVRITKHYDVRLIETPAYLVPFIPTAAMQTFNALSKPFCIYYTTLQKHASPSTSLPDVIQTLVHEEYGHCVNFLNSYNANVPVIDTLSSTLDTPITEGISFHRELEALHTFEKLGTTPPEKKFKRFIEQYCSYDDFILGMRFTVYQWRIVRFLRAISDVRLNLNKQTFPQFIEWAHKKTKLTRKLIFDQTFHFQERPGYAPCYSVFGQQLATLQRKANNKKIKHLTFNTYAASIAFPPRSVYEQMIKKKFKI